MVGVKTVRFTSVDFQNIMGFLGRVELKGNEVPAFVNILRALEEYKDEEKESE